jgi:DNA invertase Pin-like site-specific DNA recombinase
LELHQANSSTDASPSGRAKFQMCVAGFERSKIVERLNAGWQGGRATAVKPGRGNRKDDQRAVMKQPHPFEAGA